MRASVARAWIVVLLAVSAALARGPGVALDCVAVPVAGPRAAPPAVVPASAGVLVDVMVVYTPSSRVAAGGTAAIEALIDSYFDYTNMVYEQSGVDHRFRLVHAAEVAYVESGNSLTDLARLRDTDDGFMDGVHALRDQWGADLVSLINTSGSAGVAYQMTVLDVGFEWSAFSAIGAVTDPIPGGLVFAHETGHNMGCQHNNEGAGGPQGLFCYSFGYRTPDEQWRTIMSYSPGEYVDFFSSPDVEFMGQPLGVAGDGCPAGAAHNVRSLNEAAATVAQFRPTVVPPPCPADIDRDGAVDVDDFLALLAAWGPCPAPCPPACALDLDGDCAVGVDDFLALLASWGPC